MLFQTNEAWEVKTGNDASIYSVVELSLNVAFFILTVAIYSNHEDEDEDDRDVIWRKFFIDPLEGVIITLKENDNIADYKLDVYLHSSYSSDDEVSVKRIYEIHEGIDQNNVVTHRYRCADGSIFYDLKRDDGRKFVEGRRIYFKAN